MNRRLNSDSGVLEAPSSSPVKTAGLPLILTAVTGLYSGAIKAAWQDGGDFDTAFGTDLNTEYIYGFTGVPGSSKCLKTVDDPAGTSSAYGGYITKISTDTTCTDFDTNGDGTEDASDAVNASLVAYESTLSGDRVNVYGSRITGNEVMFHNSDDGIDVFTANGLSSGSITGWTVLDGSAASFGSIDESTGRYLLTDTTSGKDFNVSEFYDAAESKSAVVRYDPSTDIEASPQADLVNDRVFIRQGTANEIMEISGFSTTSQVATNTGFYGYPVEFIPAAVSAVGYDTIVILDSSSRSLKYIYDDASAVPVDEDGDSYTVADGDCDDTDASVNPGATEACDSVDNDCDGDTDEAGADGETAWYADADGDGFGDPADTVDACDQPEGYVDNGDDCDDTDYNKTVGKECYLSGECDGESESGTYEEEDTVCAPYDAEGTVASGVVEYYAATDTTSMTDNGDWMEFVGQFQMDSTAYNSWTFVPSDDAVGGYGLGIAADAMESRSRWMTGGEGTPPPSAGDVNSAMLRIDSGTVTGTPKGGEPQTFGVGIHTVEGVPYEGDADADGDSDTDSDADADGDTDSDADGDSDADTANPDDTGEGGDNEDDSGRQPRGGCNACSSTPLPDSGLAMVAMTALAAGALSRRRRSGKGRNDMELDGYGNK